SGFVGGVCAGAGAARFSSRGGVAGVPGAGGVFVSCPWQKPPLKAQPRRTMSSQPEKGRKGFQEDVMRGPPGPWGPPALSELRRAYLEGWTHARHALFAAREGDAHFGRAAGLAGRALL